MESFTTIVNGFQSLTIVAKPSILVVGRVPGDDSAFFAHCTYQREIYFSQSCTYLQPSGGRSVLKTPTSHQTSVDECQQMQRSVDESLGEPRQMQTSVDESLDKCRRMQTSVNESIKRFSDINGGFPRWMFFNLPYIPPAKDR